MSKNLLERLSAVALAVPIAFAYPSISVSATEGETTQPVHANAGETKSFEGNVSVVDYGAAVEANGEGAKAAVEGNVVENIKEIYAGNGAEAKNGGEVTITGDVSAISEKENGYVTGANAQTGGEVTINGNVSSDNRGVYAYDKGEVTVEGNVDAKSNGVESAKESTVEVKGSVNVEGKESKYTSDGKEYTSTSGSGISVNEKSKVTVNGDVNSLTSGISAGGGSEAKVEGNVTATGSIYEAENYKSNGSSGVSAYNEGTKVEVGGNVSALSTGVVAGSGSNVTVEGNVTASGGTTVRDGNETKSGTGLAVSGDDTKATVGGNVTGYSTGTSIQMAADNKTEITVKGDVIASSEDGVALSVTPEIIWSPYDDQGHRTGQSKQYSDAEEFQKSLPEITVHALTGTTPIKVLGYSDEKSAEYEKAVAETINYIIKYTEGVSNIEATKKDDLYTTKLNQEFSFTVSDGYDISLDSSILSVKQENGKYIVTLNNVQGGINLNAIKRAIEQATGQEVEVQVNPNAQPVPEAGMENPSQPPATALYVAPANSSGVAAAAVAVEGAKAPSRAVTLNIEQLTPVQFQGAIINNIDATPAGTSLRVETNKPACFDRNMLNAFAKKATVDMEVIFTYNGQKLRVVIPAGYDITKLLDENGYCGFLRLAAILGANTL
nr:hypothetical protein [uncultured Butyrivibrio sp.]